jgi:hypothetical protein
MNHDSLDNNVIGPHGGAVTIGGAEHRTSVGDRVHAQYGLAFNERRDDIAGTWVYGIFQNGHVSLQEADRSHGVIGHPEGEASGVMAPQKLHGFK